jgi:hypothetical protein
VITVITRQLHFWHLVKEMLPIQRSTLNQDWWAGFHATTHLERVHYLERRGTNASTIIFWIHLNMTFFGLYKTRSVIMQSTKAFDGTLALKEIAMSLYLTGTDTRREAYDFDRESQKLVHKESSNSEAIRVCGISESQVDSKNEFLLTFCEDLLSVERSENGDEVYIVSKPSASLTNKTVYSTHSGHKSDFFGQPVCFNVADDKGKTTGGGAGGPSSRIGKLLSLSSFHETVYVLALRIRRIV